MNRSPCGGTYVETRAKDIFKDCGRPARSLVKFKSGGRVPACGLHDRNWPTTEVERLV